MRQDSTALVILPAEVGNSLVDAAELEFQATLQLLADRACWVSGARFGAIALAEHNTFAYKAVSGDCNHEPGETAEIANEPLRECIAERWTVRCSVAGNSAGFIMAVPVVQDEKAVGFIELQSNEEFTAESSEAVSRIADLVIVSLEHYQAALRAEKLEFREEELELPSLWHAPENALQAEPRFRGDVEVEAGATERGKSISAFATCTVCGFPVSPTRSLCVECEQKPESVPAATLFTTEPDESWLSTHGYTIASVLVSVITAAIILWLRR